MSYKGVEISEKGVADIPEYPDDVVELQTVMTDLITAINNHSAILRDWMEESASAEKVLKFVEEQEKQQEAAEQIRKYPKFSPEEEMTSFMTKQTKKIMQSFNSLKSKV